MSSNIERQSVRTGSHHETPPSRALRLFGDHAARELRLAGRQAARRLSRNQHRALRLRDRPRPFGDGRGPAAHSRTFAWRDYGNRVGVWRLFDLLDELGLPACHLINTTVLDYAPEIPAAINARKDEYIGHGRANAERQGQMWEEDEARLIAYVATSSPSRAGGRRAAGWGRGCRRAASRPTCSRKRASLS